MAKGARRARGRDARVAEMRAWECLMIVQSTAAPAFLVSLFLFFNPLLFLNNYLINSFKVIFIFSVSLSVPSLRGCAPASARGS